MDDRGGVHRGGDGPPDDDRLHGMLEAIEATRAGSRRKPLEQVKARLIDELRKRAAFLSSSMVEWHSRHLAVPGWALRHPLRARRLQREGPE